MTKESMVNAVRDALLSEFKAEFINMFYPVGSIYMSVSSANPADKMPGTVWEAWGSGRVPVGVDSADSDFSTVEKTGGNKAINIAHSHTVKSHSHKYGLALGGYYADTVFEGDSYTGALANGNGDAVGWTSATSQTGIYINDATVATKKTTANMSHYKSIADSGAATPGTDAQLSSTQSVMQPYITCYMWKRTA